MPDVNMPKLSDTMEEGTVLDWKKSDGDEVKKGEVLAEIESDKASFEIEAEADGVLHIVVDKGAAAPVGAQIATIGGEAPKAKKPAKAAAEPAEDEAEEKAEEKAEPTEDEEKAEPTEDEEKAEPAEEKAEEKAEPAEDEAEDEAEEKAEPAEDEAEAAPAKAARKAEAAPAEDEAEEKAEPAPEESAEEPEEPHIKASPIAARLAAEMGVDLRDLTGSGPEGRIVKEDVLKAADGARKGRPQAPAREERRTRPGGPEVEVVEPNRMQQTIAKRMTASKTTVPHFYVTVEARVDEAVRMRQQLKDTVAGADKVTMTDFLTRACAIALTKFPEVNASWVDGHFERKRSVNIGLAVPPAQGLGLLVPVVHDVDQKDLVQISIESRQVIERARSGKPGQGDLDGGTFSISNLGMFGVDEFNAIINPPESAILAVGAIKDVPVIEEGQVKAGKVMRMTLSVDHRVFYGATAAQFMAEVRRLVENPVSLVVPPEA